MYNYYTYELPYNVFKSKYNTSACLDFGSMSPPNNLDGPFTLYKHAEPYTGMASYNSGSSIHYMFYRRGILHKFDGPAHVCYSYDYVNGHDVDRPFFVLWHINYKSIDPIKLLGFYENNGIDVNNITPEEEVLIETVFGKTYEGR